MLSSTYSTKKVNLLQIHSEAASVFFSFTNTMGLVTAFNGTDTVKGLR